MKRALERLPSLDLIRTFESAARHLSFTRAAAELFVTQSAVSRSIKTLEEQLGVRLFQRRHRALLLTEAGQTLYRAAGEALDRLRAAHREIRRGGDEHRVTVTTTLSFASLWLIPRLPAFRERHPEVEIRIAADTRLIDLEREDVDLAIRYCTPAAVPPGTRKLFGEHVFPVCSPALLRGRYPLARAEDLRHHVLLHVDNPRGEWPWLQWSVWFEAMRLKDVTPAGALRFNEYDHLIQAAMDGQGVALGRSPLVQRLIGQGRLVAPIEGAAVSSRAYFVLRSRAAGERAAVRKFADWLAASARQARTPA